MIKNNTVNTQAPQKAQTVYQYHQPINKIELLWQRIYQPADRFIQDKEESKSDEGPLPQLR